MGALEAKLYQGYDSKTENYLKKEFYYFLQLSAIFPYLRGNWFWLYMVHYLVFFTGLVVCFFQLLYTSILIKDQLGVAAQTFHVAGGLGVCISILWLIPYHRQLFFTLVQNIQANFYDYGTSFDTSTTQLWLKDMHTFKLNMFKYFPILLVLIAAQGLFLGPIQDTLQGYEINSTYVNNVFMKAPMPMWFPFEINIYWALAYEVYIAVALQSVLGSGIFCICYFTHAVNTQLKILSYSILNLDKRALKRCNEKYLDFDKNPKQYKLELYNDPRFIKEYEFCIKQNVEHHIIILRSQEMIDTIQKWPMFNTVFFMSLVIACSLFIVLKGDKRIAPQLFSLLLLIMEIIAIMIICWRGQELIDECHNLYEAFYKTKWIHCSIGIRKSIILIQEKNKKPRSYKAGGLTDINWELFGTIMNTAYSYFNLMLAMKED